MKLMGQDLKAVMHERCYAGCSGTMTNRDKGSVGSNSVNMTMKKKEWISWMNLPSGVCLMANNEGQMATDPFFL